MIGRRALILAGAGSLLALSAGVSSLLCAQRSLTALNLQRLDVVLPDIPAASRIGQLVRSRVDPAEIELAFWAKPRLVEAIALDCDDTRRIALRSAFRESFSQGEVVNVDGWILSVAECTVAALRVA